jgi:hypothetical protein
MNRIRVGVVIMTVSLGIAVAAGVAVAMGTSLAVTAVMVVVAEVIFWLGVLILGHSTYKVARAKGWRRVPGELWRLFRQPSGSDTPG